MVHPTFGRKPETTTIERIAFLDTGREFEIVRDGNWRGISLRPLIEDMGLSWGSQFAKIKKDEMLAASVLLIETDTGQGRRETLCMDIQMIPWFMSTINPSRVRKEIKETVKTYRRFAAKAIFDATFGQLERQNQQLAQQAQNQEVELAQLRQSSQSLRVQYELFDDIEQIHPRKKLNGLLNLYSGPGNSYQVLYRLLGRECDFDVYAIRDKIAKMGGKATLIAIVEAHKMLDKALEIAGRMIQTLQIR